MKYVTLSGGSVDEHEETLHGKFLAKFVPYRYFVDFQPKATMHFIPTITFPKPQDLLRNSHPPLRQKKMLCPFQ